ncbi:hypothetical protein Ancab_002860 [Ancistrocladus abbreviatus]
MRTLELIFIPLPAAGHLFPTLEVAKRLVEREERLSVTVLIMNFPFYMSNSGVKSLQLENRINIIELPQLDEEINAGSRTFIEQTVEAYKPMVKQVAKQLVSRSKLTGSNSRGQLAGFVLDMFCTAMIDVAGEMAVPSYVFFTSCVGFLSLMLHLQSLRDDYGVDITKFADSDVGLDVPGFRNRVPARGLPLPIVDASTGLLDHAKRFRDSNGIIVNTFMELESHLIVTLSNDRNVPPIYPLGPIVNLKPKNGVTNGGSHDDQDLIMQWLDDQLPSSVVFLCFGTLGTFDQEQVREIATGLEQSGHHFLWSLRRPSPSHDEKIRPLSDYEQLEDILPSGFLERTAQIGKVTGWIPQTAILSHPAVGGFVSHCGWNSTLESLWFGVPIAAWPMYAEQQLNAFELVKEVEVAVEVRLDYRWDPHAKLSNVLVGAKEIEKGIRRAMDGENGARNKMKAISEKSRKVMMKDGSSYTCLGHFVEDIFENVGICK